MLSRFQQYQHHADGRVTVEGLPNVKIDAVEGQSLAQARQIEQELGLPTYFEEWEVLAKPRGMSGRAVHFVLLDESPTNFAGQPSYQPRCITLPQLCGLEFGHRGFLIGTVCAFTRGYVENREDLKLLGIEIPAHVEGDCILGTAYLFNSALADKAWEAIERGIFTHVCPLVLRQDSEPFGTGELVEVSLVPSEGAGCPGARILKGTA